MEGHGNSRVPSPLCRVTPAGCPVPSVPPPPRCKQCSNTLRPGAYRATVEPGVFVCSSHHPTATTASPTLPGPAPRQPGTAPTDSKPLSTPQTAQKAQRQRDQGPGARPATWELMVGNSTAKGFVPAAAHPRATTSSHVLSGSPAGPQLSASPMGGKASMCVTNSSPTVLSSPAQDTVAVSPCPAVTQSAPDPRLATQGWSAPQTKLSLSPVSAGQVNAPAWTLSASRTQQARERFLQTPGAMPSPGPAGRAPAAADTPSGVSHREQALSCLRKALPRLEGAGAQAPGRCVWGRGLGCPYPPTGVPRGQRVWMCGIRPVWLPPQTQIPHLGSGESEAGGSGYLVAVGRACSHHCKLLSTRRGVGQTQQHCHQGP